MGASPVWSTRGQRLDEAIDLFRHLWSGSKEGFKGRFYSYDEGWFGPTPPQGAKLPIMIGGHSEKALERAAKRSDVWQSVGLDPEGSRRAAWIREHAGRRRGRTRRPNVLSSDPEQALQLARRYKEAGAEHLCSLLRQARRGFRAGDAGLRPRGDAGTVAGSSLRPRTHPNGGYTAGINREMLAANSPAVVCRTPDLRP